MFTPFLQKLRKGFSVLASRGSALNQDEFDEEMDMATTVPDDVKEGYFTVFAVNGKETQRFVIELDNLTNPEFLSLLEQAREEYGFQQKGVLSLPCRPQELQEILQHRKVNEDRLINLMLTMKATKLSQILISFHLFRSSFSNLVDLD